jgi:hypothetical protein
MPSLTVRLPPDTLAGLKALSSVTGTPTWRLVDQAVRQGLKQVKGAAAEDVRRLSKRELTRIKAAHPPTTGWLTACRLSLAPGGNPQRRQHLRRVLQRPRQAEPAA